MADVLVPIGAAAAATGYSVKWLRTLADAGVIPVSRTAGGHRRFDLDRLQAALDRRSTAAGRRADVADPVAAPDFAERFALVGLEEDRVWSKVVETLDLDTSSPVCRIIAYAFNEMLNNAIDHAAGVTVLVEFWANAGFWAFRITDDGVGVFPHLRDGLGLADNYAAIAELTKGKRTTAPDRHTGEGIFFTSKQVDMFRLAAAGIRWTVDNVRGDQAVGKAPVVRGTTVFARLDASTTRDPAEVFHEFTLDTEFVRTRPVVKLFDLGLSFVSRSEARRLLDGLDEFEEVEVDFVGIEEVGQGFVDELLRVWPTAHPDKSVIPINMSGAVEFMVRRGLPGPDN